MAAERVVPSFESLSSINESTLYVVIDAYRFSSAVITAFEQGANSVIPVKSEDQLNEYVDEPNMLLGGEPSRGVIDEDRKVENSSSFIRKRDVDGKNLALNSTNGALRVGQLLDEGAENIAIGSTINARALGAYIREEWSEDVRLIPAQNKGAHALEDIAGSMLINQYIEKDRLSDDMLSMYRKMIERSVIWKIRAESPDVTDNQREDAHLLVEFNSSSIIPLYRESEFQPITWDT